MVARPRRLHVLGEGRVCVCHTLAYTKSPKPGEKVRNSDGPAFGLTVRGG